MGWKGTLRSVQAANRRIQRDAEKQLRSLERQQKAMEKEQESAQVAYEVALHENYLDLITSIHKSCTSDYWDWQEVLNRPKPVEPQNQHIHEREAAQKEQNYQPNPVTKWLKLEDFFHFRLVKKVAEAKTLDEQLFREAMVRYHQDLEAWTIYQQYAERICNGDHQVYKPLIDYFKPFAEIQDYGSNINCHFENTRTCEVNFFANSNNVIPSKTKTQLKSGKLSEKKMPIEQFNEYYQDYVCSCSLRIALELFQVLPLDFVVVNVLGPQLNKATGKTENVILLSVAINRETLYSLNLDFIDPSESMSNFVHEMAFSKRTGFQPVEKVRPPDLAHV